MSMPPKTVLDNFDQTFPWTFGQFEKTLCGKGVKKYPIPQAGNIAESGS